MTSHRRRPKPAQLMVDFARAELLSMALFDQRQSLQRTLRLLEANPKPNYREKFEIEETKNQLATCSQMHREVVEMESKQKE